MPHAGILSAITEHQPIVLGISATMIFNLPKVRRLIDDVRQTVGDRAPHIILGGSAAGFAPDLRSARTLVNQLSD